eukprot:357783-Chlamydomonas_euryale.AAC.2
MSAQLACARCGMWGAGRCGAGVEVASTSCSVDTWSAMSAQLTAHSNQCGAGVEHVGGGSPPAQRW